MALLEALSGRFMAASRLTRSDSRWIFRPILLRSLTVVASRAGSVPRRERPASRPGGTTAGAERLVRATCSTPGPGPSGWRPVCSAEQTERFVAEQRNGTLAAACSAVTFGLTMASCVAGLRTSQRLPLPALETAATWKGFRPDRAVTASYGPEPGCARGSRHREVMGSRARRSPGDRVVHHMKRGRKHASCPVERCVAMPLRQPCRGDRLGRPLDCRRTPAAPPHPA